MSLLKNRNNEFERKLQEQLDDTEFKPSESLWGRIDREVNRPEFEQRVEGKIGNYQLKPYPETWEQIEAQLPPPAKSRRRWGALWIASLSVIFAGAFVGGYLLSDKKAPVQSSQMMVEQIDTQVKSVDDAKQTAPEVSLSINTKTTFDYAASTKKISVSKSVSSVSKGVTSARVSDKAITKSLTGLIARGNQSHLSKAQGKVVTPTILPPSHVDNNNQESTQKEVSAPYQTVADIPDSSARPVAQAEVNKPADKLINEQETPLADTPKVSQLTKLDPVNDSVVASSSKSSTQSDKSAKISLTVIAGAHLGSMMLKDPNGQFAENIALRKQVESSELDWSGGFLLDYKLSEKWLVSSGIQFTHLSMSMTFGTTTTSRYPTIEPGGQLIVMDSVTKSGPNSLRIKYSWNEIPLLFTYRFNTQKRLSLETKFGVSYAIVSVVDAAMIAQNNVGVYNLKSQDAFPGFNNLFFAQAFAGIAYRLNESVTLTAMPYAKLSLNNMISRENWVKQYPLLTGLSVGLRKSF